MMVKMLTMHLFKPQINTYEIPGDSFHRYYLWNSIAFFAFSMVGHMLANILLYIEGKTCNFVIPKNNNELRQNIRIKQSNHDNFCILFS